jgi:erythromycin esterase-like protein
MIEDLTNTSKIKLITESAYPLDETGDDYQPLLKLVGDATLLLLGESTHGTHEFYKERAEITKLLIKNKGFNVIAIEGDWPDAYRVNRYINRMYDHRPLDNDAVDALSGFQRFPSWMWVNADVVDFVGWLRSHNDSQRQERANLVSFFGLDLYSMFNSAHDVIHYLERIDSSAAIRARARFSCLEQYGHDSQKYAYNTGLGLSPSCEIPVALELSDLLRSANDYRNHNGGSRAIEEFFNAEQNCRLVKSAEHYYRSLMRPGTSSWNIRDEHMMDTVEQIIEHHSKQGVRAKVVVWAHNSHIGDARATDMANRGELNLGQLLRERYGPDMVNIGFTTSTGNVTAASSWNGSHEIKKIRTPMAESYEDLFNKTNIPRFFLNLRDEGDLRAALSIPMLERAIGVVYKPEFEHQSHYFNASLPKQFDAVIHLNHSRAVEPIDHISHWSKGTEAPESYPTGL